MSFETSLLRPEMNPEPNEMFMYDSLTSLAKELAGHQYPGYPAFRDRLCNPALTPELSGVYNLPPGHSDVGAVFPDPAERAANQQLGLPLDQWGRPLHPWLEQMITDPSIGVVTGRGFYQKWGPNYTADSVVIKNGHILVVERHDMGTLALPGGFVDPEDTSTAVAAEREVKEESTFDLAGLANPILCYQGLVVDIRMTAHAWPETTAFLFDLGDDDTPLPHVQGKDDAKRALWLPIEAVRQAPLFGSHSAIIELALAQRVPA